MTVINNVCDCRLFSHTHYLTRLLSGILLDHPNVRSLHQSPVPRPRRLRPAGRRLRGLLAAVGWHSSGSRQPHHPTLGAVAAGGGFAAG